MDDERSRNSGVTRDHFSELPDRLFPRYLVRLLEVFGCDPPSGRAYTLWLF
jgi:hypothetical protein